LLIFTARVATGEIVGKQLVYFHRLCSPNFPLFFSSMSLKVIDWEKVKSVHSRLDFQFFIFMVLVYFACDVYYLCLTLPQVSKIV